jgi:hypothetical protein
MKRIVRFIQVQADLSYHPQSVSGLGESDTPQHMSGYIMNQSSTAPWERVKSMTFRMIEIHVFGGPLSNTGTGVLRPSRTHPKIMQLHTIGQLVPLSAQSSQRLEKRVAPSEGKVDGNTTKQQAEHAVTLRPVQSGVSYRITSPPERGLVRVELAGALEIVFERFAREHGFSATQPIEISLSRGFKANSHGHKEGRAADIDAVGSKSLLQWKQDWDQARATAEKLVDPGQRSEAIAAEQRRNLGYRLYKALQAYGGWRVNPGGWRVYQNVMQLFGPWTATEGPWKAMQIENPNPKERQRLADQRWVFEAHHDHIHVAR